MNIYPIKEQLCDDGVGILVSGINIKYFKFQCPVRYRSIVEAQVGKSKG